MNNPITQVIPVANGEDIILETGRFAKQADGSVMLKQGNTMMLATVVSATELRPGVSFFPLSVDYQEKFSSNGKIPGGFLKREGRLSDYEILTSRLIDRTLRPLFPNGYQFDTQVILTLYSVGEDVLPDALAGLAASAALAVSDIPFDGPISEVRVGRLNGEFIINPTRSQLKECDIDMIVGATYDNVMMVEGEMKEISEEEMIASIRFGHEEIKKHCEAQNELAKKIGSFGNKREFIEEQVDEELYAKIESIVKNDILAISRGALSKDERKVGFKAVKAKLKEAFSGDDIEEETYSKAMSYFSKIEKKTIRNMMLDEGLRLDGRGFKEVRNIEVEANVLPSPHGSSLFTRGETQALATVTLGTKLDEKMIDNALEDTYFDKFYLHYNFPAFSVGETKPKRGPSRREVGHGNLAFRSLKAVMPTQEECPYTIRIVSDVLESNGSSSMATVCSGSMALMDAGVPIKGGVSGIAMGMVSREDGKYAILTDILGEMNKLISDPRDDYKGTVPRMVKFGIPSEFIGAVIGPGGKIIQELQAETNTTITIEEVDDQGMVAISSMDREGLQNAVDRIKLIASRPEVGDVYEATVKSIKPFGAFVEFLPGKQGLLHISEISWARIEKTEDVFSEGDTVKVKLLEVDKKTGKFRLSRKVLIPKPERKPASDDSSSEG